MKFIGGFDRHKVRHDDNVSSITYSLSLLSLTSNIGIKIASRVRFVWYSGSDIKHTDKPHDIFIGVNYETICKSRDTSG